VATPGDPPVQGTCVGFEIRSDLPFATVRRGGGTPLVVTHGDHPPVDGKPLMTWRPKPGNPFEGRLVAMGSRLAFWASDAGWYVIDPGVPSIAMESGPLSLRRELRLFGVPTTICSLERGDLSIHAASVDVGGRAVLLAGPSRYGKTTLAGAFARAGHRLLSEDSTRCAPGPPPLAFPGPAAIRLRPDVATALAIRGARIVAGDDGRVPLLLDPATRGSGDGLPIGAVLILRQAADRVALRPLPAANAIRDLLALTFHLPSSTSQGESFGRIADLAAAVPAFDLYRPMTIESLGEVVALVEDLVGGDR
jgi:hypothetical protein